MSSPRSTPKDPPTIDWEQVQDSLRRHLAGRLDHSELTELDDLVQESCIRLLRVSRRERVENLEALVSVVARRTFTDYLRRRYRNERLWTTLDDGHVDIPDTRGAAHARFGDLIERIEFIVLEVFARDDRPECRKLARAWFASRNWKDLAEELDLSHASVRKRWSRCLELPRKIFRADPEFGHLFRRG
jgi:DNA-directed RNA polymerase specialized sigma24 family protein